VGAARDAQDSHAGHGFVPKLILAGRLTGTLDGRPVVIDADERGVMVSFASVATAWAARRSATALVPVLAVAQRCTVPVRLNVAGLVSLEVLPRPSRVVRMLVPRLADLL
jgi:hypothetical protein